MKKNMNRRDDKPSTVKQLTAAMIALGKYTGENSDAERTAEAKRLGGMEAYRLLLANALLGIVETDAMFADSADVSAEQMQAAHWQALKAAGAEEDPGKLLHFLRWRTLRVEGPLREIAQNTEAGPLPLAAAHAAEGLQLLLGICAAGQNLEVASPAEMTTNLKGAREALTNAAANIDVMLNLLAQAEDLFSL
ncbi:hypothetical protein KDA_76250 [Dictyobacter alpinus]|uniref:Uncharacterized protein n=1 Tax=Dictyobacter alpinus TaxID=2014873 RepID=A0A402BLB9_9CHLR|nr:DUF6245 family protein [Dictyobacter alpinus]GCE32141.1 hypothetical protein KDA_76250 [Dictyobacter alpinus]